MISRSVTRLSQHRGTRFVVAGGVNSLFGFTVYSIAILVGLPVWGALVVANIAGLVFNFMTMGRYVFRNLGLARFPRFAASYVFLYLINLAAIDQLSNWIPGKIIDQAILTIPMALLSYVILRRFVFTPTVAKPSGDETSEP